jgi:hypothetical protein
LAENLAGRIHNPFFCGGHLFEIINSNCKSPVIFFFVNYLNWLWATSSTR